MRRHTTRWVPACLCYRSSSSNRKWMRTHFEKCFEIHGMSPFCLSHNQVSTLSVLPATISPRPKTPRCCYALLVVMCSFRSCSFHPDRIYIYIYHSKKRYGDASRGTSHLENHLTSATAKTMWCFQLDENLDGIQQTGRETFFFSFSSFIRTFSVWIIH